VGADASVRRVQERKRWQNRVMEAVLPIKVVDDELEAHAVSFKQRIRLSILVRLAEDPTTVGECRRSARGHVVCCGRPVCVGWLVCDVRSVDGCVLLACCVVLCVTSRRVQFVGCT